MVESSLSRSRIAAFGPYLAPICMAGFAAMVLDSSAGAVLSGVILGSTGSLIAVSMALIWRSHRVISFAQSDLGSVPATLVALTIVKWQLPYFVGFGGGLVVACLLGTCCELLVMRRLRDSPRMIATVATLGLGSVLGFLTLVMPGWFGELVALRTVEAPFSLSFSVGKVNFGANDVIALVVSLVAIGAVASFLRFAPTGIAIRASAERPERAGMLGISVSALRIRVWMIASVLCFMSIFLTGGITGISPGFLISFTALLQALVGLMLGGMEHPGPVAAYSVAVGIFVAGMDRQDSLRPFTQAILLVVIVLVMLVRRGRDSRPDAERGFDSQAVADPRPRLVVLSPAARLLGLAFAGLLVAAILWFPFLVSTATLLKAGVVLVFAVIGLSLVVLSGWAGQASFGQIAFVGIGGAATAKLVVDFSWEPAAALGVAAVIGALSALVIGVPALRLGGVNLTVVTLGFSLAVNDVVLSNEVVRWIPTSSFKRPQLLHRIPIDTPLRLYGFALGVLVLAIVGVVGLRRSRVGRALRAVRDNESAAASYGISVTASKLLAFAISGAIASLGGALLVLVEAGFRLQNYDVYENVSVFSSTVVGGMSSPAGAVLGALFRRSAEWLLPLNWQVLATGLGVLVVAMIFPQGLIGGWAALRDAVLRALPSGRSEDGTP